MALSREDRIRERLFPGVVTFHRKGFSMLPIVLRRAQFLFTPRSWQIYTYLLMRTGKTGVTWLTMTEMARDLAFNSTGKLRKYVDQLVADGWINARRSSAKEYFIAPDPYTVLRALDRSGRIPPDRREELNELLELLNEGSLGEPPEDDARPEQLVHRGVVYRRSVAATEEAPQPPGQMSREEFDRIFKPDATARELAAPSLPPSGATEVPAAFRKAIPKPGGS